MRQRTDPGIGTFSTLNCSQIVRNQTLFAGTIPISPRHLPLTQRGSRLITAPDRTEFADYYLPYVEKVAGDDVMTVLMQQAGEVLPLLESISEERSLYRYGCRQMEHPLEEFKSVRAATLTLFENLPREPWMRRGVASGNPFSVRALAYICAGHVAHHAGVLQDWYR